MRKKKANSIKVLFIFDAPDCSLVCVTKQHYVFHFFTRLWSVLISMLFKYIIDLESEENENVVLFCNADKL